MMAFFGDSYLVVTLSTVLFVLLLLYLGVHKKVGQLLDDRAARIKAELDDARAIREEAQTLLASYEKKQKEAETQVEHIIATAKAEAERAAEQAQEDLKHSIARRLKAAEDQIASAEAAAVQEVRDRAVEAAIAAAARVISARMTPEEGDALIEKSIAEIGARLH